jgi:ribosome maturation factor RimP
MEDFVVQLSHEEEELKNIIEPLLDGEGFELVRLSYKKTQSKASLGLFIDTKDKPNGIAMENLEFISRFLSDVLDAASLEGVLSASYDLEVSSPGLDRPLTKSSHFQRALNERVKIRLKQADEYSSRTILGKLAGANAENLSIQPDGKPDEPRVIAYRDIADAHVIFDFNKQRQLSKKKHIKDKD